MTRIRTIGSKGTSQDSMGIITRYFQGKVLYENEVMSPSYYRSYKSCADEVHPDFPKSGGPLSIVELRQHFQDASCKTGYLVRSGGRLYNGEVHEGGRRALPTSIIGYPSEGFESCKALGPEAWDRFKPRIAKVSLGQFLAEIKDTPQLLKFQLKKFKDLGSGYLNVQFGWKPFLSDLRSWYQSIIKIDRQIAALKRHNGKWLKRGGTLYDTTSSKSDDKCVLNWSNYCTPLYATRTIETQEKAWFKGSFRYYIPGLDDGKWGDLKAMQNLWGLEITPALVYELLPYSWLVDWFSNVGSVMSNYTSATNDNMAAKYAYIMRKTTTEVTSEVGFTARWSDGADSSNTFHVAQSTSTQITRARAAASPYGFNIDWADFNQFQVSILAALGISRQRF